MIRVQQGKFAIFINLGIDLEPIRRKKLQKSMLVLLKANKIQLESDYVFQFSWDAWDELDLCDERKIVADAGNYILNKFKSRPKDDELILQDFIFKK
jgi:hypothetical protein